MKIDPYKLAIVDTEHAQQVALFCWAGNEADAIPELKWLFAIPNGGRRDKVTAANMAAEGARAGVPDTLLPVAKHGFHGLFIEMKKKIYEFRKNGGRSDEQIKWGNALTNQGYAVVTCYSFDHAKRTILSYLEIDDAHRNEPAVLPND